MKVLVGAWTRVKLDVHVLRLAREIHLDGIARDLHWDLTDAELEKALRQIKANPDLVFALGICGMSPGRPKAPMVPNYTFQAHRLGRAIERLDVENIIGVTVGVEANNQQYCWKDLPAYAERLKAAGKVFYDICPDVPLYATTVQGLENKFMMEIFEYLVERFFRFDIHTYRTTKSVDDPWKPFLSRDSEFAYIKSFAWGFGRWCNMETGWHSAKIKKNFLGDISPCLPWGWKRFSEREIADFLIKEIRLHEKWGADFFSIYQAYTGDSQKPDDLFGLLTPDRKALKPRAVYLGEFLKNRRGSNHDEADERTS